MNTMSCASIAKLGGQDEGAVLVEFALTLPLLLLIIVGVFDFGLAFREYAVVTNAAREGARMAVLPGYADADVTTRVAGYLQANGVVATPTINTVKTSLVTPDGGALPYTERRVTVQVEHVLAYVAPFARFYGGTFGSIPLTAVSAMRTEVAAAGP
jgi:Flp pilus assembly protein TadG